MGGSQSSFAPFVRCIGKSDLLGWLLTLQRLVVQNTIPSLRIDITVTAAGYFGMSGTYVVV